MTDQWRLPTANSEYVVSLAADAGALVLDHWGAPVDGDVPVWSEPDRTLGFVTAPDVDPLEYATAGHRHAGFSELLVDRGDGHTGARWRCRGHQGGEPGEGVSFTVTGDDTVLEARFVDETGELVLTTRTCTSRAHDVVRRCVTVENRSSSTVTLPRVFSGGWPLPVGPRARIDYLAGSWSNEFGTESILLNPGTFSIGSRQGVTSLNFSPVVTVSPAPRRDGEFEHAVGSYGIALEWSGSWRMQAESVVVGDRLRVSCGLDEDTTTVTLQPGESFTTPDTVGVWSPHGPEGVASAWHHYQRTALARSLDAAHRPVVYNSWEATTFDVTVDGQLALADLAADLGAEVFVVDDGWFVGRTSDRAGMGDWTPDPAAFPDGLGPLADAVLARGMRFGLWVEPEAVNPDSDLYRAHPDWIYRAPGREPVTIRNQFVLDLGRLDVLDWVAETLRRVLRSAPISYLKWDMNRSVSDGGRPADVHGREWSVQHTRGYYRLMEMLREEFPHVTVEACSSGGGRIDNAVLARSDVVWTSDETGPVDRLGIQHGFLTAYPPHVMGAWVTDASGHRDRRDVSFEFRFVVAMAGVLGIGGDLVEWSQQQRRRAAELVTLYKGIREVIHRGAVARHGVPGDTPYAIEYAYEDRTCMLVYDRDRDRSRDVSQTRVFPVSLAEGIRYRLRGTDRLLTASEARSLGVVVPFALAGDCDVLIFDPE